MPRVAKRTLVAKVKEMDALLAKRPQWVKGKFYAIKEVRGKMVEAYCLLGAKDHVLKEFQYETRQKYDKVLTKLLEECIKYHYEVPENRPIIARFNDARTTKFEDIRTVMDCVVDDAEQGRY